MKNPIYYPERELGMTRFIDGYVREEGRVQCVYVHFDTDLGPNRGYTMIAFCPTRAQADEYLDACKTVADRLLRAAPRGY